MTQAHAQALATLLQGAGIVPFVATDDGHTDYGDVSLVTYVDLGDAPLAAWRVTFADGVWQAEEDN